MSNAGKDFRRLRNVTVGEPNRQVEFARQARYAANVIAMLMRNDNTAQLLADTPRRARRERVSFSQNRNPSAGVSCRLQSAARCLRCAAQRGELQ